MGEVTAGPQDAGEPVEPVQLRLAEVAAEAAAQPERAAWAAVPLSGARAVACSASPVLPPEAALPVWRRQLAQVFSRRQEAQVLDVEVQREQPAADG